MLLAGAEALWLSAGIMTKGMRGQGGHKQPPRHPIDQGQRAICV